MLKTGTKAPDFSLADQNDKIHRLSDHRGQKVILYFYPHDMSPGCTTEACSFADRYPQFREKGALIIGVSADPIESHKKFEEEHSLPFTLLSDPEREVIKAYDVWKERLMFGKPVMDIQRSTYLIDEEGVIIRTYEKVKPKENAKQILKDLN